MLATDVAEVVGTSSDPAAVPALWAELRPDVTLCDVHMPRIDGFDLCRLLHEQQPDAAVLLFSARDDHTVRNAAAAAGAAGLISKTASPAALAEALTAAVQ